MLQNETKPGIRDLCWSVGKRSGFTLPQVHDRWNGRGELDFFDAGKGVVIRVVNGRWRGGVAIGVSTETNTAPAGRQPRENISPRSTYGGDDETMVGRYKIDNLFKDLWWQIR